MPRSGTSFQTLVRRRNVLRGLGAGVLVATGAGTINTVAAQSDEPTVLDLRESGDPSLPVVDELLIFVHGWFGSSVGPSQAADLADVLADGGYEPDRTVAFVYDASNPDVNAVMEDADAAAAELAALVQTAIDEGAGSVRLVGHSLGGRVVLETLTALESGYVVDTVAPLGAAAVGSTVTVGGRWYDGVAERARAVRNYHSERDDVIQGDFGSADDTALGAEGAPDPSATPSTYTDVDVTDAVASHGAYTSSAELGQDLAEAIARQDDGESTPCEAADAATGPEVDGRAVCDLNGDGRYEDVNGNGNRDFQDVVAFFEHMGGSAVQNDVSAFDFNGNGGIDFADVITLFEQI